MLHIWNLYKWIYHVTKKNDWRTPGHNLISKSHRKEGATQKTTGKKKIGCFLTPPPSPRWAILAILVALGGSLGHLVCYSLIWYSYGTSTGFLWDFYGMSMIFLWNSYEMSEGNLWYSYGISLWFLCYFHVISMIFLWGFLWDFPWYVYDISMGFLWDLNRISMVLLWYVQRISLGILWDFHEVSWECLW